MVYGALNCVPQGSQQNTNRTARSIGPPHLQKYRICKACYQAPQLVVGGEDGQLMRFCQQVSASSKLDTLMQVQAWGGVTPSVFCCSLL